MRSDDSITTEPLFYITVFFFALLATALPTGLGQLNFLPIAQTLSLTVFLGMVVRQRAPQRALRVMIIWLAVQFCSVLLLTWFVPGQAEQALANGFNRRVAILEWFYANRVLPDSIFARPGARLGEIVGVLVGSLLTGGLIGNWLLVRAVNLTGFLTGSLLPALGNPVGLVAALPIWTVLRLAGYAGFVIVLAEPLLTGNWSIAYYWTQRRRLLLISTILLLLGVALELALPGVWRSLFGALFPGDR